MTDRTGGVDKLHTALAVALFALGAALIVAAASGEIWFDELWSLRRAMDAGGFFPAVTAAHDNNHALNTAWVWILGEGKSPFAYRALAILSGFLSLALFYRLASRWGRSAALFALALAATSYPLAHYFSEARGYGPALFFTLLALYALNLWEERQRAGRAALFAVAVAFGLLSHATYLMVYLAFALHSARRLFEGGEARLAKAKALAALHAVPAALCGAFYLGFASRMEVGGGLAGVARDAMPEFLLALFGLPDASYMRILAFVPYAALLGFALWKFWKTRDGGWLLYVHALFAAPALMTLLSRSDYVYWRYYVLCVPFAVLLAARALAELWRAASPILKAAALLLLVAAAFGQSLRLYPLLEYGRGDYRGAIEKILSSARQSPVLVTSNNNQHNPLLLAYYAERLGVAGKLRYVPYFEPTVSPAEYFLFKHVGNGKERPKKEIQSQSLGKMGYIGEFKGSGGISGWSLWLYQKK